MKYLLNRVRFIIALSVIVSTIVPILGPSAVAFAADEAANRYGLSLEFSGLEDLGEEWVYEGWLIVDGAPVSTGRFTVDTAGDLSDLVWIESKYRQDAAAFVLTIEPAQGDDPAPSDVHMVGGDFVDGMAELTVAHPAALGDDFSDASGSYILAASIWRFRTALCQWHLVVRPSEWPLAHRYLYQSFLLAGCTKAGLSVQMAPFRQVALPPPLV